MWRAGGDAGRRGGRASRRRCRVHWTPPTWDEIVREHSARVYRLAYRLTGNSHDAEDLTQEVFVRVFRSLSSYTPGTFEGWLHRITTNLFLDMARRKQRIRFEGLGDDDGRAAARRRARPGPGLRRPAPGRRRPGRTRGPARPSTGPRSCSATSRACPTRRSPTRWGSSWAPCAAGSTAAGPSSGPRWTTAARATAIPPRLAPAVARPRSSRPRRSPAAGTAPVPLAGDL